jgi:hypothetical protein
VDDAQYELEHMRHHAQKSINVMQQTLNEREGCLTTARLISNAAAVFEVAHVASTHEFSISDEQTDDINQRIRQFMDDIIEAGRKTFVETDTNNVQEALWAGMTQALLEMGFRAAMEAVSAEDRRRGERKQEPMASGNNLIQMPTNGMVN